jgi:hypothetical protein
MSTIVDIQKFLLGRIGYDDKAIDAPRLSSYLMTMQSLQTHNFRSARPGVVVLALDDPSDLAAIDSLHQLLDRDLELCIADSKQLGEFIGRLYKD